MKKLRQYLKENNITQKEFAKLLDVDVISLWRYLQGTRIPRPKTLKKICELTNGYVTANDFYNNAGENSL